MTRVFVLGNAGVDLSLAVARLPAPGETLVGADLRRAPGGKGLNQAVVAARAGAQVAFAAALGADGDAVAAALAAEPIAALHLRRMAGPSDLSIVMVAPDGENCIVSSGACAGAYPADAAADFAGAMAPGDLLLMQGNLSWPSTRAATEMAQRRGGRIMLNAAPLLWAGEVSAVQWDVLVVNESEAVALTGASGPRGATLLRRSARIAIVTMGEAGCAVCGDGGVEIVATQAVTAVDSTGAGDAFCGVLAALMAGDRPLPQAIAAAQRAAATVVARRGAFDSLPTQTELVDILAVLR